MAFDPLAHEIGVDRSEPNGGFWEDFKTCNPRDFFTSLTGVDLPTSSGTTPFITACDTPPHIALRWDNAAGTAIAATQLQLPGQYDARTDRLVALVTSIYSGGGTDATPQLKMGCTYFTPGYADGRIAGTVAPTVAASTLVLGDAATQSVAATSASSVRKQPALAAAADYSSVIVQAFDFSIGVGGKLYTAETKKFNPLELLYFTLAPSVAVGASNNLDVLAVTFRIRRSASLWNRATRTYGKRLFDSTGLQTELANDSMLKNPRG